MVGRLDWKHSRSATRINTPKLVYQTLRASRAASRAWRHVAPPSSGPRRYRWRRHAKVRAGLVSPSLARLLAALLVSVWLRHRHISSPSCLDSNCATRAHLSNAHVRGWSARAPTRFPPTLDRFGCATLRTYARPALAAALVYRDTVGLHPRRTTTLLGCTPVRDKLLLRALNGIVQHAPPRRGCCCLRW